MPLMYGPVCAKCMMRFVQKKNELICEGCGTSYGSFANYGQFSPPANVFYFSSLSEERKNLVLDNEKFFRFLNSKLTSKKK